MIKIKYAAIAVLVLAFTSVQSAPITVNFTGEVTAILSDDSSGTFGANFSVGQAVNGSWTFDSAAVGTSTLSYMTAYPSTFEVTIGTHSFSGSADYRIFDNGPGGDGFSVINEKGSYSVPSALNPLVASTFFLQFLGMPTTTLSNQDLVLDPHSISSLFNSAYAPHGLRLDNPDGTYGALYFSARTVPVPAAVWLFGSGLVGLIGFARSKQAKC